MAVLAGCGGEPRLQPARSTAPVDHPVPAYDASSRLPAAEAVLALVPAEATTVTITDFDASRAALGVPELSGDSTMAERSAYWERARRESPLLAEGVLRDQASRLALDHGFGQDDVDWEAHWSLPDGAGWAVGLRPGLPLGGVRAAVREGVPPLAGAVLDAESRVLGSGVARPGDATWGERAGVRELTPDGPVESVLYAVGCVPLLEVLGPDAGAEQLEAVTRAHDVAAFEPLEAYSVSLGAGVVTARLGPGRTDLFARTELAAGWPTTTPPGFTSALADPVADPSTGRIGFDLRAPAAAVGLVLASELPFATCDEVPTVASPSGL